MAVGPPLPETVAAGSTTERRHSMVARQIAARGIADERVLEAMRRVPREAFVSGELAEFAYEDTPLPAKPSRSAISWR